MASEQQRKSVYFLIWTGILALILVLFPFFEDWIKLTLTSMFGFAIQPDGTLLPEEGKTPAMMAETGINLFITILHIGKVILGMALVITIVRFLAYLVTKTTSRKSADREISSILKTVVSVVIYIVAFFIIFQSQFPSVQLAPLFTGSTIIGIVVGLALQDTLGNLFAGLALQADQPFQVGDVVRIPNRGEGVVELVSWRGVKIRTFQNKLVILSNSVLGKELIEVAPKDNLNARSVFFNSLYTHSPTKIIHLVREAVRQVENVSPKIRPNVRIRNLGADGIDWEVKYWLDDYRQFNDTDALIRQRIWYVFQREGLSFAFPTRTLHIEPKREEMPAEEITNSFADRLAKVDLFGPLSDEEIEKLASASTSRIYAPGEAIVRMGQEGKSMFVVVRGTVKVQIPEKTYQKTIKTLKENDFFGEMSLLTGEPRTANVVAFEESEVLRIDRAGLKPILESNPVLVQTISELVEERRLALQKSEEDAEEQAEAAKRKGGVMTSIRSFFGIK